MAIRHQVIEQPPEAVWAVLKDPELYGGGTAHAAPLDLLIQLRHRSMLPRLARTVHRVYPATASIDALV